jgi:hypothetical protein
MRKERREAALPSDTRTYEYGEGAASERKGDKQTMSKTAVMASKEVQKRGSALGAEHNTAEDIGTLDASEINELVEFMETDDSADIKPQRLEEDDDSESVRRLYVNPKHIVPKAKKQKYTSTRAVVRREAEEETGSKSRWLITACRSCGDMLRFRSDQPKPSTCGKPQCIERFEVRNKNKVV